LNGSSSRKKLFTVYRSFHRNAAFSLRNER
jgi:hypothetical protein